MSFPRVIFVWQKPRWRRMSFQGFPQILLRREGWPWRNRLSSISVIFPEIKPSALFLSIRPGFCSACSGAAWCWQHDIDTSGKREKDCDALKSWEKGKLVTTLTGRGARCPAPPPDQSLLMLKWDHDTETGYQADARRARRGRSFASKDISKCHYKA